MARPSASWTYSAEKLLDRVCKRDVTYAEALPPAVAYGDRRGPLRQADREVIRESVSAALVHAEASGDAEARAELIGLISYLDRHLTASQLWDLLDEPVHARPFALTDEQAQQAMVIARAVRVELENIHHLYVPDEAMPELNRAVRNAVASMLHALDNYDRHDAARRYVDMHLRHIPSYWEPPELLDDYRDMWSGPGTEG